MIKSYVKIKPIKDDGAFGANFNEVRKGINRTGVVTCLLYTSDAADE